MTGRLRVNSSPKWRAIYSGLVMLVAAAGCGGGGEPGAGVGVSLEVRHSEPLRAGGPVRWTLVLRNDRPRQLDLEFPSGKDGDVVLLQGGRERYRWSTGRMFTAGVRPMSAGPNETLTFALEDPELAVEPGEYDLVATVATSEEVPPAERTVTVVA
ncbi:MAG: BsuPI-related putative proteinase inhibitor [Actinomycetota bacterium]